MLRAEGVRTLLTPVTTLVGRSKRETNCSTQVLFRRLHSEQRARGGASFHRAFLRLEFWIKGSLPCHNVYQVANEWKSYGNTVVILVTSTLFALQLLATYAQTIARNFFLLPWIAAGTPLKERRSGWMAIN